MVKVIHSIKKHDRMSTQDLLQQINQAIAAGETDFEIYACGQHDIGGPLWNKDGKTLKFLLHDPGQRAGSMCMENTEIIIEGPAPADVGWLNAGGIITIKGDSGDTTAHCAAAGKIYASGRVGTRSGSLMKHDPRYEPPEFWVLKNTGSFPFEFMGGGIGVVCGYDCQEFDSVLGDRACVGMVGGLVYVRGNISGVSGEVRLYPLEEQDKEFLSKGLKPFLKAIGKEKLEKELSNWKDWQKIVPKNYKERHYYEIISPQQFRLNDWVKDGIFSDVYPDEGKVLGLVNTGDNRLRYPQWENIKHCAPCEYKCPISVPTQQRYNLIREGKIREALELIYQYNPFPRTVCGEVCPNLCMESCTRGDVDQPIDVKGLGSVSETTVKLNAAEKPQKVAIVGGGVGGLSAAWHLRHMGYQVTVYEKGSQIGGKLFHAVSRDRLSTESLSRDLDNFKKIGIDYKLNTAVDEKLYNELKKKFDAVILATGAYEPKIPNWPGKEKLLISLDFLAKVNKGEKVNLGKKVVVIGAGNTGMDVVYGAYTCGAKEVTAIDVQKPSAFPKELEHARNLGAKILWPVFTKEITDKGVVLTDGRLLEADSVILAIGEVPVLDYINDEVENIRGYLKVEKDYQLMDNVYSIGDMTRLGLLADSIGHGREVALVLDARFNNRTYEPKVKDLINKNRIVTAYFDTVHEECIDGICKDVDRCISCGTCRDCRLCKESCPELAIYRVQHDEKNYEYIADPEKCIGCGICAAVCPCGIWQMYVNKPSFPGEE
ncbi:MAG: FAD-dependent oxidoreductase [Candidatus Margulisbacteria bacterium]|nr:FAD-dependent oxidoreductase [Candidatus Margulisiibacteriota bacterium]